MVKPGDLRVDDRLSIGDSFYVVTREDAVRPQVVRERFASYQNRSMYEHSLSDESMERAYRAAPLPT